MEEPEPEPESRPKLSAYELERNRNIAANRARLVELGLENALFQRGSSPGNGAHPPVPVPARKRKVVETEPARRSGRVRKVAAADIFVASEEDSGHVRIGGADAAHVATEPAGVRASTHPDEWPVEKSDLTELEQTVCERLRAARNAKARAMGRSMFIVCNDRSLYEIVRSVPASLDELRGLYGMGEKKVAAHGQLLLDALAPYADELHAAHDAARANAQAADLLKPLPTCGAAGLEDASCSGYAGSEDGGANDASAQRGPTGNTGGGLPSGMESIMRYLDEREAGGIGSSIYARTADSRGGMSRVRRLLREHALRQPNDGTLAFHRRGAWNPPDQEALDKICDLIKQLVGES